MTQYEAAKKRYAERGVDADAAINTLKSVPVSLHCWQGDDVRGFDGDPKAPLTGGIQTTGNYPGRARTPEELMADIVRVHFPDLDQKLLDQVLEAFYRIRNLPQIKKKPSTSEIIDWIQALQHGGVAVDRIVKEVPYLGVLLKKNEDIDAMRRSWK